MSSEKVQQIDVRPWKGTLVFSRFCTIVALALAYTGITVLFRRSDHFVAHNALASVVIVAAGLFLVYAAVRTHLLLRKSAWKIEAHDGKQCFHLLGGHRITVDKVDHAPEQKLYKLPWIGQGWLNVRRLKTQHGNVYIPEQLISAVQSASDSEVPSRDIGAG